jgi:outer membrane protein assembly factor BamB/CubicO group peptidase (beta-lactamase class C family)
MRLLCLRVACGLLAATTPLAAQSVRWSFVTGGALVASPAVHDAHVYIGSADGHLYAVHAATGAERWRFDAGAAVDGSPVVHEGIVYVLSRDGGVHAVDAMRGQARWRFRTRGEQQVDFWDHYLSDPLVHDDLVVFGSGDSAVYALDRHTGVERWRVHTGHAVHAAPVFDGTHTLVGGFDGQLRALDPETGRERWRFKTIGAQHFPRGDIQRAPAVVGGIAYFGSRDYNLYAVDTRTGTAQWNVREGLGWIIATPLVTDSLVYYGASDGQRVYASDRRTGRVRWSVPVQTRVFGRAVATDDAVLFGGFNGRLMALDPQDGRERWSWQVPTSRARWHTVYDTAGSFTEEFRDLYRSGRGLEAEQRILALGSIAGAPVVHEGTAYVPSTDGTLYALALPPGDVTPATVDSSVSARLDRILAGVVNGRDVPGATARIERLDGTLVWAGAEGTLADERPWFIASITKMFVAAIALQLHGEGQLPLDTRIGALLRADELQGLHTWRGEDVAGSVTVRQLLAHTSGLPDCFVGTRADGRSLERRLLAGDDTAWRPEDALAMARDLRPHFAPGTPGKAHYADTNYQLLALVLERRTGESVDTLIARRITQPLGLQHTWLYRDATDRRPVDIQGKRGPLQIPNAMASFGADGGIVSTAADLARFTRAFFGGELFPATLRAETDQFARIFFPFQAGVGFWRFHVPRWASPFKAAPVLLGHGGTSGAFAFYDPARDLVIVGSVNSATSAGRPYRLALRLLDGIGK